MVCGRTIAIEVDGLARYVIDVRAVAKDGVVTCGQAGGAITFSIDSQALLPAATWDNSQMWPLDLSPVP